MTATAIDSSRGPVQFLYSNLRGFCRTQSQTAVEFCADSGAPICLLREDIYQKYFSHIDRVQLSPQHYIQLRGIGVSGPVATSYIELPVTLQSTENVTSVFPTQVHLVDSLACPLLLGVPFLKGHQLHIQWGPAGAPDHLVSPASHHFKVLSQALLQRRNRAMLYATEAVTILPGEGRNIRIKHRDLPQCSEGYLVSPHAQVDLALDVFGSLIQGVVNHQTARIPYANFGEAPIHIKAGQRLGILEPCPARTPTTASAFLGLAEVFQGLPPLVESDDTFDSGHPFLATPSPAPPHDTVIPNISPHWGPEYQAQVQQIIDRHGRLFRPELGCFTDGIDMPIPLKPNASLARLRQAPYNLSKKDEDAMDTILDPLRVAGVVEPVPLGQPSPAASPAFVVYKNGKPRVVVDLRKVNAELYIDVYPLPRQDTILQALGGSSVFSALDMTKSYFQQPIAHEDRWKTAFVTAHRGHERLTRATMGLAVSASFLQHRMEQLFRAYLWKFVAVYIDDTIVFSPTPERHLQLLNRTYIHTKTKSSSSTSIVYCWA
jgi:hypothetical protein